MKNTRNRPWVFRRTFDKFVCMKDTKNMHHFVYRKMRVACVTSPVKLAYFDMESKHIISQALLM